MAGEGFRIAGAYVSVNLQDDTEADEQRIRARLESSGPVSLRSALADPDNLKIVKDKIKASPAATIRANVDVDDTSLAKIRADAAKAGSDSGDAFTEGASEKIKGDKKTESAAQEVAKRAQAKFSALQFALMFAGLPAAAAVAGVGVAAGLAGVPAVLAGISAAFLKSDADVSSAWSSTVTQLKADATGWAEPFQQEFVDAAGKVSSAAGRLSPEILSASQSSADAVGILTDSVIGLADNAMPGLVVAASNSRAPLLGVEDAANQAGLGVTDFFTNLSTGAESSQGIITTTGGVIKDFLGFAGSLFANLSNNGGPALAEFRTGLQTIESTALSLTSATSPLISGLEGFISTSNGALVVIQAVANALGILPPQVGQFSGSLFAATKIASAFGVNVGAAFDGLSGKIKDVANSGDKLASLGGILADTFNPTTLAVGALGVGLLLLGQDQQRVAQATAIATRAQDTFTSALRESKGAIDDNVRASVAQDLAQKSTAGSGSSVLDAAKKYGVALPLVTDAVVGNTDAMRQVNAELDTYAKENPQATVTVDALKVAIQSKANTFATSEKAITAEAAATDTSTSATSRMSVAQYAAQASTNDLKSAFDALNTAGGDVVAKGQAIIQVMDQLSGKQMSAEEATQAFNDTIRGLAKNMEQAQSDGSKFSRSMVDATGTINTTTAAGSNLQNVVEQAAQNMASYGQALTDAGTPSDEITQKLGAMRDALAAQLRQLGLAPSQIDAVLAHYDALPSDIVTALHLEGAPQAQAAITSIVTQLQQVPPDKGVHVQALTADAETALLQLGYKIVQLPNGAFQIFANTAPATAAADTFAAQNFGRVVTMVLDANQQPANGKLTALVQQVDGSVGTMTFDAHTDPATGKLQVLVQQVDGTWGYMNIDAFNEAAKAKVGDAVRVANGARGFIQVDANTGPAQSALAAFYRSITSVTIPVHASGAPPLPLGGGAIGGIVKPYASGGFFPDLTPMSALASIVPPATYRVVGDNVRVPEAYIPLDPQSQRSQAILEKANAAMGRAASVVSTPGIDYGALAAASAQAVAEAMSAVFSGGIKASFDAASMEKGLITLARRRSAR